MLGIYKTGTHYHVITYLGKNPYYSMSRMCRYLKNNIIFDSMEKAHDYFCKAIDMMAPGYIDSEDRYDSYSDLIDLLIKDYSEYEEVDTKVVRGLSYDGPGLPMELVICEKCIPYSYN